MTTAFVYDPSDENKKIKAVLYSGNQWAKLYDHIYKPERDAKEIIEQKKEKEERRLISKAMADSWENTYVNLRKKRFQLRRERLQKLEEDRVKRYHLMKREQEELKEEVRKKAKEMFFEKRDSTLVIRSAQRLSEVVRERQEQIEFNKKLRETENAQVEEEAKKIIEDVEKFKQEQSLTLEKKLQEKNEKKKAGNELMKQLQEEKQKVAQKIKEEEMLWMNCIKQELKEIKDNEKKGLENKRKQWLETILNCKEDYERQKEAERLEDLEENVAIQIIANGKERLAQLRKLKLEENAKHFAERKIKVAEMLAEVLLAKDTREEDLYKAAVAEKDAIFEEEERKRKEHAEKLRQERIKDHEEFLKRDAQIKEKEHELFKWAVLQRLRNAETTWEVDKILKEKRLKRIMDCREENRKIIKEYNKKVAAEKQADIDAVKKSVALWELDDKEFLEFAERLKEDCKAKGRPVYPLEAAIYDFKVRNRLLIKRRGRGLIENKIVPPKDVKLGEVPHKEKKTKAFQESAEQTKEAVRTCTCTCNCLQPRNGLANLN